MNQPIEVSAPDRLGLIACAILAGFVFGAIPLVSYWWQMRTLDRSRKSQKPSPRPPTGAFTK